MITPKLKKIVNVYQVQFAGFKAPGLGDFLRGCFTLCQFIDVINKAHGTSIEFDMDIRNHPMSKWIVQPLTVYDVPYSTIGEFKINPQMVKDAESEDEMLYEITYRFNMLPVDSNGIYYGFCCKYETYDIYNDRDLKYIRDRFCPTPTMASYINSTLLELGLKPKEYSVLHVRCLDGDSFPENRGEPKKLTDSYFKTLDELVMKAIDPTKTYLVLSSHNGVKAHYEGKKRFVSRQSKICHLGLDEQQAEDATRDTILDFYMISMANDVIGITPYGVCGFSQECAKLYRIPYQYIKFPDAVENFTMAHMPPAQRMAYDLLFRKVA
jgi:hypothetical protein